MTGNEINALTGSQVGLVRPEEPSATEPKQNRIQQQILPPTELPGRESEKAPTTLEEIEKIAEFLNETTELFDVSLSFQVNKDVDRIVVSVINKENDEVIRQIPSQEVVDLAKRLNEMAGVLFNETA